ncbi:MAG: hypothetical protein KAH95_16950, partial [Spirochaetales bacterium]|nr:hypothetical protein [Spirochaetales bacterium]
EELEELEDTPVLDLSGSLKERLLKLSSKNIIELADLKSNPGLDHIEETIKMEDGIFQIKDDVFSNKIKPKDESLKELVDSVSNIPSHDEEEYVNILDILDIDLPISNSSSQNEQSTIKNKSSVFSENGFNYDSYRFHFKKSNIGIVQSLMKISQQFDAVFAGILSYSDSSWKMDHTLGFNQKSIDNFIFFKEDEFTQEVFNKNKILIFQSGKHGIKEVEEKLFDGDLAYMKGGLFIPIIFKELSAYLFLGLKATRSIPWVVEKLQNLKY